MIELYVHNVYMIENHHNNHHTKSTKTNLKIENIRKTCVEFFCCEKCTFDLNLVKNVHRKLMENLLKKPGKFRTINVKPYGSLTMYASHSKIETKLGELIENTLRFIEKHKEDAKKILLVAIIFFEQFLLIHPFCNGNGRTARVLFSILLLTTPLEIPISIHKLVGKTFEESRIRYIDVTEKSQSSHHIEEKLFFVNYVLQSIRSFYYDIYYIYTC